MSSFDREDDRPLQAGSTAPAGQGHEVAGHARSELEGVADTAADRAGDVVDTARTEVRDVVDEARDAVRGEADRQSKVVAGSLGRLRDDLRAMSDGGSPRESTAQYVRQAATSLDDLVGRLEREGVEGALSGMRRFAQRRPGGFLAASAGAGFAIARVLHNADHPQQVAEEGAGAPGPGRSASATDEDIDLRDRAGVAADDRAETDLASQWEAR